MTTGLGAVWKVMVAECRQRMLQACVGAIVPRKWMPWRCPGNTAAKLSHTLKTIGAAGERMSRVPLSTESMSRLPQEGGPSFTLRNRLTRLLWVPTWALLASWTPRQLQPWRHLLLRAFGARMGPGADVRGSARVWLPSNLSMGEMAVIGPGVTCYSQGPIGIGAHTLVSQGAHLCAGTHDIDHPHFPLVTRPIRIGAHAWVAAEAFVGPGATLGDGCVLGARGVAFGQLDAWAVYAGNPAQRIRDRRWRGGQA